MLCPRSTETHRGFHSKMTIIYYPPPLAVITLLELLISTIQCPSICFGRAVNLFNSPQ